MSNPSIHTLFFDIGSVLVHVDFARFHRNLARLTGIDEKQIRELCQTSPPIYQDFEIGRIDDYRFYQKLVSFIPSAAFSFSDFVHYYTDIFTLYNEVWALVKRLYQDYRLSIISNTDILHYNRICRDYDFSFFEKPITSFQAGFRKPDASIYHYALHQLNCDANTTLFIDDKIENIVGAQKIGMRTIHFQDHQQLADTLVDLGLLTEPN